MTPEVMDAMREANRSFVEMNEHNDATGKRVAELLA